MGSGIVSTIGLIMIISNQWNILTPSESISLVLFFSWQVWGVTLGKFGIDQTMFAIVSKDDRMTMKIAPFIFRKTIPISILFILLISCLFSYTQLLILFITIIMDTISSVIISELNGQKYYFQSAIANYLNYPLFFIFLFSGSLLIDINIVIVMFLFLLTSFIRLISLIYFSKRYRGDLEIISNIDYQMGTQQMLNYLIFRADQLLITILITIEQASIISYPVEEYLYLAKFPELISRIVVYVGIIIFPNIFIAHPISYKNLFNYKTLQIYFSSIIFLFGCIFFYLKIWNFEYSISVANYIPFYILSILIFPMSIISYSFVRQGYVYGLLKNQIISITITIIILLLWYYLSGIVLLVWLVPLSLMICIILSMTINWGRQTKIYEYV